VHAASQSRQLPLSRAPESGVRSQEHGCAHPRNTRRPILDLCLFCPKERGGMEGGAESKGGVRHGGRGGRQTCSSISGVKSAAATASSSVQPALLFAKGRKPSCLALARARLLQPGAEWRVRPVRPPSLRHPRVAPHALHPHSGLAHDALHPRRALRPPPRPGAHASPPRQVRAPCAHPAKPRLGSCGPPTPTPGRPALRPCFSASAVLIHSLRRAARTRVCFACTHARTSLQARRGWHCTSCQPLRARICAAVKARTIPRRPR